MKMKLGEVICVNGRKLKRFSYGSRFIKGKCTGGKRTPRKRRRRRSR